MLTKSRRMARRAGVILLLAVSILVLMLLIALTLVLSAGNFRQSAREFARVDAVGDRPQDLLDAALLQLLRDTSSRRSVLRGQSLLEDMYGNDARVVGRISVVPSVASGNITLTFVADTGSGLSSSAAFVGKLLTVATGGAAGSAGFITQDTVTATSPVTHRVVVPVASFKATPVINDLIVINGLTLKGTILTTSTGVTNVSRVDQLGLPTTAATTGQLLRLTLGTAVASGAVTVPGLPNTLRGYYNGCVLTMLDGPAKGCSTRIVDSNTVTTSTGNTVGDLRVLPFESDVGGASVTPVAGDNYLINDRPFNGTGNGFNQDSGVVDAVWNYGPYTDTGGNPSYWQIPYALLPNLSFFDSQALAAGPTPPLASPYLFPGGTGGQDEDYDAADFQNMFLAMVPPGAAGSADLIPSFHRPALLNYLKAQAGVKLLPTNPVGGTSDWARVPTPVWRKALMRPLGAMRDPSNPANSLANVDHPNFTGSNPAGIFDPLNGPWDVDNDGDGITDSVWVDLGSGIVPGPDGKLYKPLFAILCLDLDGRVNLNAHGTPAQVASGYIGKLELPPGGTGNFATTGALSLPLGQGVGPPEINLARVFVGLPGPGASAPTLDTTMAKTIAGQLMQGRTWNYPDPAGTSSAFVGTSEGRYGEGAAGTPPSFTTQLPGKNTLAAYNLFRTADPKLADYPPTYWGPTTPSAYGIPPDLEGLGAVGLDFRGQPLFFNMGLPATAVGNATAPISALGVTSGAITRPSTPYALDLSRNGARPAINPSSSGTAATATTTDAPYTAGDLERVLRMFDADAGSLPPRLYNNATLPAGTLPAYPVFNPYPRTPLTGSVLVTTNASDSRLLVTTDSFSVPASSPGLPSDVRTAATSTLPDRRAQHIADLLTAKLKAATPAITVAQLNIQLNTMLPREVLAGLPMDLNRPIGNNVDDNTVATEPGFGVVDEPGEVELGTATNPVTNQLNDDPVITNSVRSRQIEARHLYVLAMLLADQGYILQTTTADTMVPDTEWMSVFSRAALKKELVARRLAQWAINVVDFRDPDSIMTPFEYDVNPFNGWDTDGDLATTTNILNTALPPERRVVWGCEYPDVLLTETLAFHDRRVKDEDTGADKCLDTDAVSKKLNGSPADTDMDQVRLPQGSLFLELYCPRSVAAGISGGAGVTANSKGLPRELYPNGELDLAKPSPAVNDLSRSDNGVAYPIWRLAISESTKKSSDNDVLARLTNYPEHTSLQPEGIAGTNGMSLLDVNAKSSVYAGTDPAENPVAIERIVWFGTTTPPPTAIDRSKMFWGNVGSTAISPGGYLVVGPRPTTYLGSKDTTVLTTLINGVVNSNQRITLATNAISMFDLTNTQSFVPTDIQAPRTLTVAAGRPASFAAIDVSGSFIRAAVRTGLNVSEPLPASADYYREPPGTLIDNPDDIYFDSTTGKKFLDRPLDEILTHPNDSGRTIGNDGYTATETYLNYKTVFVQRLANPLLPYQPTLTGANYNPYITIDWMPIDLTVFNGEDAKNSSDPAEVTPPADGVHFGARQRGTSKTATNSKDLWGSNSVAPPGPMTASGTPPETYFRYPLTVTDDTLGWLNTTFGIRLTAPAAYVGDPSIPFPWLTWNNRPFLTPIELLLVPACSQARLTFEFARPLTSAASPYDSVAGTYSGTTYQTPPFPFLLNMLQASDVHTTSWKGAWKTATAYGINDLVELNGSLYICTTANTGQAPPSAPWRTTSLGNLYRLLEYIRVPSKFVGTDTVLSASTFSATSTETATPGTAFLHFPFNAVSRFRDPGLVNINTITGSAVWDAILNGTTGPSFPVLLGSRRGYTGPARIAENDAAYPTNFAGVFRSAGGADQVPLQNGIGATNPGLRREGVDAGLLRRVTPGSATSLPLFFNAGLDFYNNTDRNAYFAFRNMARLSNLVTTRSNVYAVWITVGYFEVAPSAVDLGHPDGYQLGPELGMGTGQMTRHRSFYIIDRSIPVGYERGQNNNVQKTILLKRNIE